jgi:hypothetical protein
VAGSEAEPEAESEEPEPKPVVRDEMDDLNDLVAGLDEDHVSGTSQPYFPLLSERKLSYVLAASPLSLSPLRIFLESTAPTKL